jgi:hypothetical protein
MEGCVVTKPNQEPDGFAEFWSIWRPHKRHTDGRGEASDTFAKHLKRGLEPQDIVDGARWFIRGIKERDRDYIPLASTWLNRRDYLDGCELERAFQAKEAAREEQASAQSNVTPIRQQLGNTAFLRQYNQGAA